MSERSEDIFNVKKVLVIDGRKDSPEPGQDMVDVQVNEYRVRCVVRFNEGNGAVLIQQDWPIGWLPNVWRAVYSVLGRIHDGEPLSFPIDITAESLNGPF